MRLRTCLAALLSLLMLACGGGGGSTNPPGLPSPSALKASESGVNEITLTWTPPSGSFDGYELEGRVAGDAFQKLHTGLIPNTYTGLILTFTSLPPENITLSFRLRAASGASFSAYSNEALFITGPDAPGQPTAAFDWKSSTVNLTWQRMSNFSDGLRIERTECDQNGNAVGVWTSLPTTAPLASSYTDTSAASNHYYSYRITNLQGSRSSQPSPSSPVVYTGLVSISWVTANYDSSQTGVVVSWGSNAGASADGVRLERVDSDANGNPLGNWAVVIVPAGYRTSFLDQTVAEGGCYLYRVSNLYGATATPPCSTYFSVAVPLRPPINLRAVATQAGIQLTWQNQSAAANQVIIRRTPGSENLSGIAILPPSTATYLDAVNSLGYYTYTVVAKNATQESPSPGVTVATLNPSGALALSATALNLPSASDAALRPTGSWAFASTSPFGVLSNNDPWPATFPSGAGRESTPLIQVDRLGWPHVVYATSAASGTSANLAHLWYDGSVWKSETLASAVIPFTSANQGWTYRLDSTGTPHVLLDHVTTNQPNGGATATLSYVHKVNGSWAEESLAGLSPSVSNIGTFHLTLDGSDIPHILLGNWGSVIDYVRSGPGTWNASTLPTGTVQSGWYDFLDFAWVDGSNGWAFFERDVSGNFLQHGLWVIQMKSGVWQTPVLLGTREHDGASTTAMAGLSSDNTRVAVVYNTSVGVKAYHQTATGWHETLIAPYTSSYPLMLRIGFDGKQKVHLLNLTSSGFTDYHE